MAANPALARAPGRQGAARADGGGGRGRLADRLPAHRRRQLHHRPDARGRRRPPGRRLARGCGSSSAAPARPAASSRRACRRIRRTRSCCSRSGPHYRPGRWPAELSHSHRIIKETHDWGYLARAGASPRIVHVPRGRVVGGSSVTNGAIALRGHPEHYDEWDALVDGYGWESWLPWFRAIEADRDFGDAAWHGADGPDPDQPLPAPGLARAAGALLRGGPRRRPRVGRRPQRPRRGRHRADPAQHGRRRAPDPGRPLPRPGPRRARTWSCAPACWSTGCVLEGGRARRPSSASGPAAPSAIDADAVIMALGTYADPGGAAALGGRARATSSAATASRWPPRWPGSGGGCRTTPRSPTASSSASRRPPWPNPWYQCLLTGAHEVGGERRVYQVMPYSGTVEGGQRFTDLNVQVADARSRRGRVRLQGRDPAAQPVIEMGWFLEPSDRAAAVAAGRRLLEVARTAAAGRRAHALAGPGRPRPGAAHRRDLPPPGRQPAAWAAPTTPTAVVDARRRASAASRASG